MKKRLLGLFIVLLLINLSFIVSAATSTYITGKVYNADFTDTIPGASVVVDCNGEIKPPVISKWDGTYSVKYENTCKAGHNVTATATYGVYSGTAPPGIVHDGKEFNIGIDLAVLNIPLIPEFSLIIGVITVFSAIAVFFVVRRK